MSFEGAFNALLFIHKRPVTLIRPQEVGPNLEYQIQASPSNYFRNLAATQEIVTKGREFVIPKSTLVTAGVTGLFRGDLLQDPELGDISIVEVREMFDFGGQIMGYRVRCE